MTRARKHESVPERVEEARGDTPCQQGRSTHWQAIGAAVCLALNRLQLEREGFSLGGEDDACGQSRERRPRGATAPDR